MLCSASQAIAHNVRVYDQLRLQSTTVSSYADIGHWVTDVSVLYFDSDSQTTNQAIGYTRCCALFNNVDPWIWTYLAQLS